MGFFIRLGIRGMLNEQNEADRISRQTRLRQRRLSAKRRLDRLKRAPPGGQPPA